MSLHNGLVNRLKESRYHRIELCVCVYTFLVLLLWGILTNKTVRLTLLDPLSLLTL